MKKRVYLNFLGMILLCALLLSALASMIFYNAAKKQEIASIKDRARLVSELLNRGINDQYVNKDYYDHSEYNNRFADYISDDKDTARMTIISADGTVLLDNKIVAATLENHSGREEFKQALQIGSGEAIRYSSSFGAKTYYYAIRLNDGNVLRVSKTMSSISGVFATILPGIIAVTAIILLLANVIARRLTANIIRPLNDIDFEGGNVAVYDELLPYVKKIDRQKQEIEEQLTALENRAGTIDAITGNMKEGLILIDKTGVVLSANKSVLEVFGETNMRSKNILHICREIKFRQGINQCLSGVSQEIIFERGGKIYNVYSSPVYSGDDINGAVILFLDITERQRAEKQRREFSANVSHELKTPLTTISALSEMIESGMAREEDVKDFAAKITGQAKRLINIIDDIIRLSEFDEGTLSREYMVFDLYGLAESVITDLQEKADEKRVSLCLTGEHLRIKANRRMIDELLYNLIDNGIKYNKECGHVTVTLSEENGFYKISVEDTGIGIPVKHQSRVFERFYRVDKSRSKKTGGTGLGLSIVKHITEHHGGRVELKSAEGKGTVIACYIANY